MKLAPGGGRLAAALGAALCLALGACASSPTSHTKVQVVTLDGGPVPKAFIDRSDPRRGTLVEVEVVVTGRLVLDEYAFAEITATAVADVQLPNGITLQWEALDTGSCESPCMAHASDEVDTTTVFRLRLGSEDLAAFVGTNAFAGPKLSIRKTSGWPDSPYDASASKWTGEVVYTYTYGPDT